MLLVGLTGGLAAGKSTIARRLAELGAVVIDADQLAREVLAPGTPGLAAVARRFGPGVLAPDSSLDRGALAAIVFDDDDARRDLEAIVHPAVGAAFEAAAAEVFAREPDAVVVHDIPLLVENGLGERYDVVVIAHAPRAVRLERAIERGLSEDAARRRMAAQASDAERLAAADVVIDTSGTLAGTLAAVDALWAEWASARG